MSERPGYFVSDPHLLTPVHGGLLGPTIGEFSGMQGLGCKWYPKRNSLVKGMEAG